MTPFATLTIREKGTSSIADLPWAIPMMKRASQAIQADSRLLTEMISGLTVRLSDGSLISLTAIDNVIDLKIRAGGRLLSIRTPDPFTTGYKSRSSEGTFANTADAMLRMTSECLEADLTPESDRIALNDRRWALAEAIAWTVISANSSVDITEVNICPPGPVGEHLVLSASNGRVFSSDPLHGLYNDWMPICCVGLAVSTTDDDNAQITLESGRGTMRIKGSSDPVEIMRGLSKAVQLAPLAPPIIPDDDWEPIF